MSQLHQTVTEQDKIIKDLQKQIEIVQKDNQNKFISLQEKLQETRHFDLTGPTSAQSHNDILNKMKIKDTPYSFVNDVTKYNDLQEFLKPLTNRISSNEKTIKTLSDNLLIQTHQVQILKEEFSDKMEQSQFQQKKEIQEHQQSQRVSEEMINAVTELRNQIETLDKDFFRIMEQLKNQFQNQLRMEKVFIQNQKREKKMSSLKQSSEDLFYNLKRRF